MSARLTLMLRAMSYTPGVSSRCLPRASWLLIACTESDGLATKKSLIGRVRPGVRPSAHVDAAGVRPGGGHADVDSRRCASTNRYGFSRLTGVVSSVVYGGLGNAGVVRGADDAREDLVPHAVGPARDLAVAGQPLLLRPVERGRQARSRR